MRPVSWVKEKFLVRNRLPARIPLTNQNENASQSMFNQNPSSRRLAGGTVAACNPTMAFIRNDTVAVPRGCDASSQKVGATPSSRNIPGTPLGLGGESGDEGVADTLCDAGVAATRTSASFSNCIVPVYLLVVPRWA